jgi:hypothetical protein
MRGPRSAVVVGEVADLWASLGARVDTRAWAAADARRAAATRATDAAGRSAEAAGRKSRKAGEDAAAGARRGASAVGGLGAAWGVLGAYVGGRAAYGALIKFNATAEDARNQIAGMIALSKNTKFADELGTADGLMASLQKRAASLPGTTSEYIKMLGNIAQPVTKAGLGLKDLEDLTVGAVVAAKALGEDAAAAARDVGQALRGQAGADDPFIGKLLDTSGYTGQEGRARFNAKSAKERAKIVKELLTKPQLVEMAKAQGDTFNGVMSTLKDSLEQFFGKVGKPLFAGLAAAIRDVNKWLAANEETIKGVASAIGGVLVGAFAALGDAISFLGEHQDVVEAVLIAIGAAIAAFAAKAAIAWLVAFGPIIAVIAAVAAVIYAIRMLQKHPEKVKAAFARMWEGIKAGARSLLAFFVETLPDAIKRGISAAFRWIAELPIIREVLWALKKAGEIAAGGGPEGAVVSGSGIAGVAIRKAQAAKELEKARAAIAPAVAPALQPSSATGSGGTNVQTGPISIQVNSPNADPKAVAMETKKAFAEEFGNALRRTKDQVG